MAIWALCLMLTPSFAMAHSITSVITIETPNKKVVYEKRQDGVDEKLQHFTLRGMDIISNVLMRDKDGDIDKILDKYLDTEVTEKDVEAIRDGISKAYYRQGHTNVDTYFLKDGNLYDGYIKIRVFDLGKSKDDVYKDAAVDSSEVMKQNK